MFYLRLDMPMTLPPKKAARMGRPIKPPREGERVGLSFRVTPELKRQLTEAAARSGRGQSQEAEFRLEKSFEQERLYSLLVATQHERHPARAREEELQGFRAEVAVLTEAVKALKSWLRSSL